MSKELSVRVPNSDEWGRYRANHRHLPATFPYFNSLVERFIRPTRSKATAMSEPTRDLRLFQPVGQRAGMRPVASESLWQRATRIPDKAFGTLRVPDVKGSVLSDTPGNAIASAYRFRGGLVTVIRRQDQNTVPAVSQETNPRRWTPVPPPKTRNLSRAANRGRSCHAWTATVTDRRAYTPDRLWDLAAIAFSRTRDWRRCPLRANRGGCSGGRPQRSHHRETRSDRGRGKGVNHPWVARAEVHAWLIVILVIRLFWSVWLGTSYPWKKDHSFVGIFGPSHQCYKS